jgi:hypothetical protein
MNAHSFYYDYSAVRDSEHEFGTGIPSHDEWLEFGLLDTAQ